MRNIASSNGTHIQDKCPMRGSWITEILHGKVLLFFIVCVLLVCPVVPAFSHRVNIFAYVEGDTIYTESYFSDGTPVTDGKIEVTDSSQNTVFTGRTDSEGLLSFKIPKKDDLTIVLDAGMGHRATFQIPSEELSQPEPIEPSEEATSKKSQIASEPKTKVVKSKEEAPMVEAQVSSKSESDISIEDIRTVVQEEISRELEPISKRIARLEKKTGPSVTEIFGGIGYIIGLMGLIMYFKSKAKK
jgi:nickel transport protein